jgi:REP element-mobilizing transposase RayT
MPRPWRITYAGALYHITARGNARQTIFRTDDDRARFMEQLQTALESDEVILYAYALMNNHYHLLVQTPLGNIKRFMQRLNTAYSMYYRYKHNKPGHCFQGRYGAKLVGGDEYIVRLTRYIHLNPVNTKTLARKSARDRTAFLLKYPWSSLKGYLDKAQSEEFVDYRWLALMRGRSRKANSKIYARYIEQAIADTDKILQEALSASRYAIGDDQFIEDAEAELKGMHLAKACGKNDIHLPKEHILQADDILAAVADSYRIEQSDLFAHGHIAGEAKTVAIELCCRLTGKSQREIGNLFGYHNDASVVRQRKKFREQVRNDSKFRRKSNKIEKILKQNQ